jgi:hypothetical protein
MELVVLRWWPLPRLNAFNHVATFAPGYTIDRELLPLDIACVAGFTDRM